MRFRDDYAQALTYKPDIMVIPECETLDKIKAPETSDSYWIGDNVSKGLGVFTFNDFKIDLYDKYTDEFKYILPLVVSKGDSTYKLIAVWTKKVEDKKKNHINYIRQLHFALKKYELFITSCTNLFSSFLFTLFIVIFLSIKLFNYDFIIIEKCSYVYSTN